MKSIWLLITLSLLLFGCHGTNNLHPLLDIPTEIEEIDIAIMTGGYFEVRYKCEEITGIEAFPWLLTGPMACAQWYMENGKVVWCDIYLIGDLKIHLEDRRTLDEELTHCMGWVS